MKCLPLFFIVNLLNVFDGLSTLYLLKYGMIEINFIWDEILDRNENLFLSTKIFSVFIFSLILLFNCNNRLVLASFKLIFVIYFVLTFWHIFLIFYWEVAI